MLGLNGLIPKPLFDTYIREAIKNCFIFPPHLTGVSTLPGETQNPEIVFLLKCCMQLTMSAAVSVVVSKMGVIFHQTWSENELTVLLEYLTISTYIRCYEVCDWWQFYVSAIHRTDDCCIQHSPIWCSCAKHPSSFLSGHWPLNGPELNSDYDEI